MLEEEMARGYHTSNDTVCADCFIDDGIRAFIQDHLTANSCSVCERTADEPVAAAADDVLEFFLERVQEHYQDADGSAPYDNEDGNYQVETWDMYDLIFDELYEIADSETLEWLYRRLKDDVTYCKRDWQVLSPGEALKSAWQQFCHAVKHETRFLFFASEPVRDFGEPDHIAPAEMLSELGDVIKQTGLIRDVPAGTRVFRVRGHEDGEGYTQPVDLGPPREEFAKTAGRMNAPGIVVMYAAFDRATAIAEGTGYRPALSLAEFETAKNLRVVDLTNIPPVPSIFEDGPREYLSFLSDFAKDVSKPFTPDKEIHVEYTPTQVVSEFLRHRLRDNDGTPIRGVLYRSAKEPQGTNIAIFVESSEVEGAPSKPWSRKEPLLRLVGVEELVIERAAAAGPASP